MFEVSRELRRYLIGNMSPITFATDALAEASLSPGIRHQPWMTRPAEPRLLVLQARRYCKALYDKVMLRMGSTGQQEQHRVWTYAVERSTRNDDNFYGYIRGQLDDSDDDRAFPVPKYISERFPDHQYWVPLEDVTGFTGYSGSVAVCPHCQKYFCSTDDFGGVTDGFSQATGRRTSTRWCDNCVSRSSFYCDYSDETWSTRAGFESAETWEGNTVCIAWARHNGWVYDEDELEDEDDEGTWYSPEAYAERNPGWVRPHTGPNRGIPAYHRAQRSELGTISVVRKPLDRTFGIELEVEFLDSQARQKYFNQHHTGNGGLDAQGEFTAEVDGSLDSERGLEIIGGAFPLSSFYGENGPWQRKCRELHAAGAIGWAVRARYGMHVNLDIRPLGMTARDASANQELLMDRYGRFVAFFHNNKAMTQMISGRKVIYGHNEYTTGYDRKSSISEARLDAGANKYVPCRLRPNKIVAEVRTFGANVRFGGILRNVEFVDSALHYVVSSEASLFYGASSAHYRQWLLRAENAKRWQHIAAYLAPTNVNANPKLVAMRADRG